MGVVGLDIHMYSLFISKKISHKADTQGCFLNLLLHHTIPKAFFIRNTVLPRFLQSKSILK